MYLYWDEPLSDEIKSCYTTEKYESLKEEVYELTARFRYAYKELWNRNHTFSKYTPVYTCNKIHEHPFCIGNYENYLTTDDDLRIFVSENGACQKCNLHFYDPATLQPFYSTYPAMNTCEEEFHIVENNSRINVKYNTNTEELCTLSKENFDEQGRPSEYYGIAYGRDYDNIIISKHYHYLFDDNNRITGYVSFFWFNTKHDIKPPVSYISSNSTDYNPMSYTQRVYYYKPSGRIDDVRKKNREFLNLLNLPWFGKIL